MKCTNAQKIYKQIKEGKIFKGENINIKKWHSVKMSYAKLHASLHQL